jgi:hypothetical protein
MADMSYPIRYALGLLVEEMGEALQLIGKALRFGIDTPGVKRLDGTVDMEQTPRTMLPTELGDVAAATEYAAHCGLVSESEVASRAVSKLGKLLNPDARDNLGRRLAPAPADARRPDSPTLDPGVIQRLRKYVAEYEDAPTWGGPTMYPAPPAVADLKALLAVQNG